MVVNKLHLKCTEDTSLDVQDVRGLLWMGEDLCDASRIHSENKVLSLKLFSKSC